jgi:hypothetical protein
MADSLPYAAAASALWPRRLTLDEHADGFVLTFPVRRRWRWVPAGAVAINSLLGVGGLAVTAFSNERGVVPSALFFLGLAAAGTAREVLRRGIPTVLHVGAREVTLVVPRPGVRRAVAHKTWRVDEIRELRVVRGPLGVAVAAVCIQPRAGRRVWLLFRARDRELLGRLEQAIGRFPLGSGRSG